MDFGLGEYDRSLIEGLATGNDEGVGGGSGADADADADAGAGVDVDGMGDSNEIVGVEAGSTNLTVFFFGFF